MYGTGFGVAAAGVSSHNIGLMYLGNLLCGVGYGCAYTPPIQACLDWFPDKKGLASGIVIGGFGSGALFFTPAINALSQRFSVLPTYLGQGVEVVVEQGRQYVSGAGGQLQEVVYATTSDLAKLPYSDLAEGWWVMLHSIDILLSTAVSGMLLEVVTQGWQLVWPPWEQSTSQPSSSLH